MYPEVENCYRLAGRMRTSAYNKVEIVPSPKHRLVLVSNLYQHKVCTQKNKTVMV